MPTPTHRAPPRFTSRRLLSRNPGLAGAVLALTVSLHVLPWFLWSPAATPRSDPPATVRVSVLRLEEAPRRFVETPRPDVPTRAVARRAPRRVAEPWTSAVEEDRAAVNPSEAAPTTPPASAPDVPLAPLHLDSPAIRRAIRDAARGPSLADLGDAAPGVDRKLGEAIAAGARGDCLKGEYVGGGMGLLSLPFLAIAKLREQCSK